MNFASESARVADGRAAPTGVRAMAVVLWIVFSLHGLRAFGATAVPAWESVFRPSGAGTASPIAARELADGTRMVVMVDGRAFSAVRYDAAGTSVSVATFYPAFQVTGLPVFGGYATPSLVSIDPFGAVFVGSVSDLCCSSPFGYTHGNVWIMKFDGETGRPTWPGPATWVAPSGRLSGAAQLLVDGSGDLVASILALETGGNLVDQVTFKFDGDSGAVRWGPVTLVAAGAATAALDASGNVFVSAVNYAGIGGDLEAVRYAAATGAADWGPVAFDSGGTHAPGVATVDGAGNFLVAGPYDGPGSQDGFQTTKFLGQTGAVQWGPVRWQDPDGSSTTPSAMATSPAGDVFVSGFEYGSGGNGYATLKFSGQTGQLRWAAKAAGSGSPASLSLAGNGDAILSFPAAGSTASILTLRYRGADGLPLWGPVSSEGFINYGHAGFGPTGFLAANGNVFLSLARQNDTGLTTASSELEGMSGSIALGPTTFAGVGAAGAQLNEIAVAPDGNLIVTGGVTNAATGLASWATLKYDAATGNVLWGPSLFESGAYGFGSPWQVMTDGGGNAIVAGYMYTPSQQERLAVVKYAAATGQALWTSAIVSDFTPFGLAVDAAGDILVEGQMFPTTTYDTALVKFSGATGQLLWGPVLFDSGVDDYPYTMAVDASGNAILIGGAYDGMTGIEHWFTWKASGVDGHALWGPVFDTATYGTAEHVVVDGAGDVIATGLSENLMRTVKYSGATGATLWGPITETGPENATGGGWLAVDGKGDVVVTGTSFSQFAGVYDADFITVKYNGSNGATLWGPVYFDSNSHGDERAYGVALDAAGNAVVSGPSETAQPGVYRNATLKYDGATGSTLWGPVRTSAAGHTFLDGLAVSGNRVFLGAVSADAYDTVALTEALGIATAPDDVTPEACGAGSELAFAAANGTPAYSWSVTSGALPPGLSLGSDGAVSGAAVGEGSFPFRVQVQDSLGATASRDFALDVTAGPRVPVFVAAGSSCQVTLSVSDSWASYQWLPGGETTPTIAVTPLETTTYGVLLADASGCVRRGAVTVVASALTAPGCFAPSIASISPSSGPAGGGTMIAVTGGNFQPGAALLIGGTTAESVTVVSASSITATTPALPPGTVHSVVVFNPDTGEAGLPAAWTTDFLDVGPADPLHSYVLSVLRNGITSGCGGGDYCPQAVVTRAQMAVFLLKAEHGPSYAPPACTGVFLDVPCPSSFANWIEQLRAEGVTGGCSEDDYCPANPVTRAQMAVFLLKTEHGSSYVPPGCTAIFPDVACPSPFADWIEQLFHENVTGGCGGGNYCPSNPSTRGQMAVFLVKTFSLP